MIHAHSITTNRLETGEMTRNGLICAHPGLEILLLSLTPPR